MTTRHATVDRGRASRRRSRRDLRSRVEFGRRQDRPQAVRNAGRAPADDRGDADVGRDEGLAVPEDALSDDERGFTIDVVRGEAGSPGYAASPNYLCGGSGKPPAY